MSKQNKALIWPYAIVASILLIVVASAATVMVALENPVQMSDQNMQDYHEYDFNVNQHIMDRIIFDKHYNITYFSEKLEQDNAVVAYKVTDKEGNAVNEAKINIMITRPDDHDTDIPLDNPKMQNGIYTFESVKLPKPGRWNLIAHVVIGEHERYYNLKADTRYPNTFEY